MVERWPSSLVARREIGKFSGGILSSRYLANLDALGEGPSDRLRIGRQIVYKTAEVAAWLEARSSVIPEKKSRKLS